MIEFQHIDFQTYTAVQEAITVLEDIDKSPYSATKMGHGLAAAYAARLRELAETPVDNEDNAPPIDSTRAVCDKISGMLRILKWIWAMQRVAEDSNDSQACKAVDALETVVRVALDPNPDNKQD